MLHEFLSTNAILPSSFEENHFGYQIQQQVNQRAEGSLHHVDGKRLK